MAKLRWIPRLTFYIIFLLCTLLCSGKAEKVTPKTVTHQATKTKQGTSPEQKKLSFDMNRCLDAFESGNFRSAVGECVKLSDDPGLLAKAIDNLDRIVQFIRILATPDQRMQACEGLFDELANKGKLVDPLMVVLSDILNDNSTVAPEQLSPPVYSEYQKLKSKVDNLVDILMLDFSSRIRIGYFSRLQNFTLAPHMVTSLEHRLSSIIRTAVGQNVLSLDNVFKFVDILPSDLLKINAYSSLQNELRGMQGTGGTVSSNMMKLAWKLRQLESSAGSTAGSRDLLSNVTNQLPSGIKQLLWHQECTIRNVAFNGFLYIAGVDRNTPEGYRKVFTRTTEWPTLATDYEGHWLLDSSLEKEVTFRILNKKYNDSRLFQLKGSAGRYDCDRRNVYASERIIPDSFQTWQIEPAQDDCPNCFLIKTGHFNGPEYMYPGAEIDGGRPTWTWIPGDVDMQ